MCCCIAVEEADVTGSAPNDCANDGIATITARTEKTLDFIDFMIAPFEVCMAAPLSFQVVKTGGFASPDFSGFAPCFMMHTLANHGNQAKRAKPDRAIGTSGAKIQMDGLNSGTSGRNHNLLI